MAVFRESSRIFTNLVDGLLVKEHSLRLLPSKFGMQKWPLRSTVNILVVALVLHMCSEHMDWHIAVRCSTRTTHSIVSTSSGTRQTCFEVSIEVAPSGVVTEKDLVPFVQCELMKIER